MSKNPRNSTDYDFPPDWGRRSPQQKHRWFVRERAFRQAIRQDTAFGRRHRDEVGEPQGVPMHEAWKRAGRGGFR